MAQILDGKALSENIIQNLRAQLDELHSASRPPHLAAILVGNHAPSIAYVSSKIKTCEKIGIQSSLLTFDENITEQALLEQIEALNQNTGVDGILVQLPLPRHINNQKIIANILPSKDVDGFHPINMGNLAKGHECFVPATPLGIIMLLEHYKIETEGKHCVILGRSAIVGQPMALLMSRNASPGNCTVTICHSKTVDLAHYTRQADILIAAMGVPKFVKADMVKPGAVVIDVGINRVDDNTKKSGYRLVGDVAFDEVATVASWITPVPGGVGPMTIAALMHNTVKSWREHILHK